MKCLVFYLKVPLFHQINVSSNQLLSITHDIFQLFDEGFEARSVFLDIYKDISIYKVWYKGLIFKLSENSLSGNLLDIISDFLSDRKQKVDLWKCECRHSFLGMHSFLILSGIIVVLNLYQWFIWCFIL